MEREAHTALVQLPE